MEKFWKYRMDHVLFWTITVGFHLYTKFSLVASAGWWHYLLEIFIRNGLLAVIVYANLDYLVPGFAQPRKWLVYIGGLLVCFVFYILVKNTHDVFLTVYTGSNPLPFWQYSFYNFSIALFYVVFSLALHLSKEWYFQRLRLRQLEVENLHTEIEYLKAQINPHFLFNSLNTIFFQIDKENLNARDTLTKFSDMLRYQLYECNGNVISLDREIQYLRNYVDLQRLRKDEKYQIEFTTSGNWADVNVAPLLLIPLVENAFKYVSHFPEGNNRVSVNISSDNRGLTARVANTKETRIVTGHEAGGIGLKNLMRRLELQYPGRHVLDIRDEKTEYIVQLSISIGI